ncbi:Capsule polysaccharide biosynthesis protein [Phocoenobacter uteri]|uniref:Capsule polysaccharide biosynthesis protein n=1 Tax=Phocoenobacter uteri TaxID=146806 RepID=A0A379CAN3_9PAST|nr:capsular biosynthesis protein [Phocoenobacter uteri]MDG6881289.1 capsule biosynthesis protein [Phocoenobacter uteri]SUB59314.1 Capsule polysaccharide biosynthesis protein [Phocoenobacter uteri]
MIKHNLDELVDSSRNILLLQGAIGNFFAELSSFLTAKQKQVFKINFNGGDDFFYPVNDHTYQFQDHFCFLSSYLKNIVKEKNIDTFICFGDNRPCHKIAKAVAKQLNIAFWVFEEGYFRPNFVTLEKQGVNAYSPIPKNADFFWNRPSKIPETSQEITKSFIKVVIKAVQYYYYLNKSSTKYKYNVHHRETSLNHYIRIWFKSGIKRFYHRFSEYWLTKKIIRGDLNDFFIVPLQVYNDSQIVVHSDFQDVQHSLNYVLDSFSQFAPKNLNLIIKHHPMDRGFTNYSKVIKEYENRYPDLKNRVFYIYDIPLPIILRQAKAMVTVNSTSGLSAMVHNVPVKVLGKANYDFEGLTYQGDLKDFWSEPNQVDEELFTLYRNYHLNKTHLNGCFYGGVILKL